MIRLAAADVAHNRRRSLIVAAGVVLAVTLVVAELDGIENLARFQVEAALGALPWHMIGFGNGVQYGLYLADISSVPSVAGAEVVGTSSIPAFMNLGMANLTASLNFVRPEFQRVSGTFGLAEWVQPRNGTVALPESVALDFNLAQGDPVSLWRSYYEYNQSSGTSTERRAWYNTTVSAFFRFGESSEFPAGSGSVAAFLLFDSAPSVLSALALIPEALDLRAYVKLTMTSLVDPFDEAATFQALDRTKRSLELATAVFSSSFAFFNSEGLSVPVILQRHYSELAKDRLTILALSLPLVGLGTYASSVAVSMATENRLPEVGMLVARGASRRDWLLVVLAEALFLGVTSGLLAAIFGKVVAGVTFSGAPLVGSQVSQGISVDSWGIAAALVLGAFLLFVATAKSMSRFAKVPITEMIRESTRGSALEDPRAGLLDYIALSVAVLVVLLSWGFPSIGFESPSMARFLGGDLVAALVPYAPILLVLMLIRMGALASGRSFQVASRLFEGLVGRLRVVMRSMLSQDLRKSTTAAGVVSLAFALVVFSSVNFSSIDTYEDRLVDAAVGSDIRVVLPVPNASFSSQVEGLASVANVCRGYWYPAAEGTVATFNSSSYLDCVGEFDPYFDEQSSVSSGIASSSASDAYVNVRLSETIGAGRGSSATIRIINSTGGYVLSRLSIRGVVKAMPGLETTPDPEQIGSSPMIYVDNQALSGVVQLTPAAQYMLVKLRPGVDVGSTAATLRETGPPDAVVSDIVSTREAVREDPFLIGQNALLLSQVLLSVAVGGAGAGLVMQLFFLTREQDCAIVVARGASRRSVARMSFVSNLPLLLLGILIGTVGGIIASLVHFETLASTWPAALPPAVSISGDLFLAAVATIGLILLSQLYGSARLLAVSSPSTLRRG